MTAKYRVLFAVLGGCLLTAATMAVEWDYCMCGQARGIPAAVLRPAHGDSFAAVRLEPERKLGAEVSLVAIAADVTVWAGFSALSAIAAANIRNSLGSA